MNIEQQRAAFNERPTNELTLRAIDLEELGLSVVFINSDRKDEIERARKNALLIRNAIELDRQGRGETDYLISACYFPKAGEVELSWERQHDGVKAHLTFKATPDQGKRLVSVIDPCVYYTATPKPAEPRLDAPAQVGHTRFGKGVPWATVIGAAQRYHAIENTPTKEQERIKRAAETIKAIQPDEPSSAQIRRAKLRADHVKAVALDKARERIAAELANSAEPVKVPSETEALKIIGYYADLRIMASQGRVSRLEVHDAWEEIKALLARYGSKS